MCVCVCVCVKGRRHIPCWSVVGMHMVTCSCTAPLFATLTYLKQYPGDRSWNRLQSKCTDDPTLVTRCSPEVNNETCLSMTPEKKAKSVFTLTEDETDKKWDVWDYVEVFTEAETETDTANSFHLSRSQVWSRSLSLSV